MIWFGWVSWQINHCRLFKAKSSLYIYIKYIWFGLVGFYGITTIVGYSMPNSLYTYILDIYDLVWFYGISTIVCYLMPNPLYTYILDIYMFWFGWVLWHINHCRLFNAKSSLYIYIRYIWFGLVGFYSISTIVGCSSRRMTLVLNNPPRLICNLTKTPKPKIKMKTTEKKNRTWCFLINSVLTTHVSWYAMNLWLICKIFRLQNKCFRNLPCLLYCWVLHHCPHL